MKFGLMIGTVLSALLAFGSVASAQTLKVGDVAPPLKVGKWVQGEPVAGIEAGKVYVVEFWATWCGPCIETIPHLNKLSKQYPDVVFIGQNVFERDESKVEPFIKKMGDQMTYRVALDDKSSDKNGAMATLWMKAADQKGIPTAFIVGKDTKIAWIGHPAEMDEPLKQIVEGTFKVGQVTEEQQFQLDAQETLSAAAQTGDGDKMSAAIAGLAAKYPSKVQELCFAEAMIQKQMGRFDLSQKAAAKFADLGKEDAIQLNAIAWTIVDEIPADKRDLTLAQKLADAAVEASKGTGATILDTQARCYFERGEIAKAVEVQTKAVELAPADIKSELTTALEKYKAKL
jgi:thiol-disulfide isomerase/thioredoxin